MCDEGDSADALGGAEGRAGVRSNEACGEEARHRGDDEAPDEPQAEVLAHVGLAGGAEDDHGVGAFSVLLLHGVAGHFLHVGAVGDDVLFAGDRVAGAEGLTDGVLVGEAVVVGRVPLEDHVNEGTDHKHDHRAEQDREPEGKDGVHD